LEGVQGRQAAAVALPVALLNVPKGQSLQASAPGLSL
jgi:hypothetical protein